METKSWFNSLTAFNQPLNLTVENYYNQRLDAFVSTTARKTVRHRSCFKGYLLSILTNGALVIPISQTGNWVTVSHLPENGRGKYFTPSFNSSKCWAW